LTAVGERAAEVPAGAPMAYAPAIFDDVEKSPAQGSDYGRRRVESVRWRTQAGPHRRGFGNAAAVIYATRPTPRGCGNVRQRTDDLSAV